MIKIIYEGVIQSLQGGSFSLVWNTLVRAVLKWFFFLGLLSNSNAFALFAVYCSLLCYSFDLQLHKKLSHCLIPVRASETLQIRLLVRY